MRYSKPAIELLGRADVLIESLQSKTQSNNDPNHPIPNGVPAYDLDE